MNLQIKTEQLEGKFNINHEDKIVLIGSCFSDEMANNFIQSGFKVNSNPFGTLFHPIAIASEIRSAIQRNKAIDILQRNDLYLAWSAAAKIHAFSDDELMERMNSVRENLRQALSEKCVLVITFGTAWAYVHKELNMVVGNCHKVAPDVFDKKLSSSDEIISVWKELLRELKALNPGLKVVFTVSPVRHLKDGLVGNNQSKARLIEAVHQLAVESIAYFPAYEIVLDELRDYRYFNEDLVHPNKMAVNFVYRHFANMFFNENTDKICLEVRKIKQLLAHKSLFPDSKEDRDRLLKANESKKAFELNHPEVFW